MTSNDIVAAVKTVVQANENKIAQIITGLHGGWEAWLQVEATLQLLSALGVGATADREQNYPAPDAASRADIILHPRAGTAIYVEIKVQNAPADNIVARFNLDIAKIRSLSSATRSGFVIVALAYMVWFDGPTLTVLRTSTPSGILQFHQWTGIAWEDATLAPVSGRPTVAVFKLA